MAISQKKKRKLIHHGKLYLWYVNEDEDYYFIYFLNILSEDRSLYLTYEINQTNDHFRYPAIFVAKSDKLPKGRYYFYPPISDEFMSAHNVRKILNWYDNQDVSTKPIEFNYTNNPFEKIDFKNGLVTCIETDFSNKKEDMLQVVYPKDYLLDVGYYGVSSGYTISIIKNQNWEHPVGKANKGFYDLHEAIICAIDIIEKLIEEQEL